VFHTLGEVGYLEKINYFGTHLPRLLLKLYVATPSTPIVLIKWHLR
jgi:hypothetical protein